MAASQQPSEVLILGAGMAGLTTARALAERGLRVLVLEARDRVGGRILTEHASSGDTVELGAEFIHGRAPELWALVDEAGVTAAERDGNMLRESPTGRLSEDDEQTEAMFAPLEELESYDGPDQPFAQWLAASNVPEVARAPITAYVEGFNAAEAAKISIRSLGAQQKAEDETEGYRSWHVRGGYAQLAEYLAARTRELGGSIELGCIVDSLTWSAGEVVAITSRGTFRAPRCVVTLPLGVLQQVNRPGGIRMQPEPTAIAHARRMEMGHAFRITLVFRLRWWIESPAASPEDLERLGFLLAVGRLPGVWWTATADHEPAPTLTGWVGGPNVAHFTGRDVQEIAAEACATLAALFQIDESRIRAELLSAHAHDWSADPFSRGAYSYVAAGGMDAPRAMATPEANTLYFAGEHTDVTGHWGTVHAAIRSGLRAAAQVLGEVPGENATAF